MKKSLFIRGISENFGGVETQVYRLACNLYDRGIFEPVLITSNRNALLAKKFIDREFDVHVIDFKCIMRGALQLSIFIRNNDIGLVQSHAYRESIIGRIAHLFSLKTPHIFRVHTYIDNSRIPSWKKLFYHILEKVTSSLITKYVSINKFARNELINISKINPNKVTIIHDAVERLIDLDKSNKIIKLTSNNIAMISNLIPNKGHDVLIEALHILKQKNITPRVRLIGGEKTGFQNNSDKSFTNELINHARRRGVVDQIEFYEYTNDVSSALVEFGIVVLPSDSEGTPNSLLEAMSIKKIIIASSVGGIPEFVEHQVTGFLHKKQSAHELAYILECIFNMSAEELEQISENGYNEWKNNYCTEIVIEKFIDCYRELKII